MQMCMNYASKLDFECSQKYLKIQLYSGRRLGGEVGHRDALQVENNALTVCLYLRSENLAI